MDALAALGGAGGGGKWSDRKVESIGDKYTAMLAAPNVAPAHCANLEKMQRRRREREARKKRPSWSRGWNLR